MKDGKQGSRGETRGENFFDSPLTGNPGEDRPFPPWLKKPLPSCYDFRTQDVLAELRITTVCRSAECPNASECWHRGSATFMILGDRCSRGCRFCGIQEGPGVPLEQLRDEPERVAEAAVRLGLRHVVITSVTRDDLPDEGAGHFAKVIGALRSRMTSSASIEVLVPDFHARSECLATVLAAGPDIFNHNLETVERLHPVIRPRGDYRRSLEMLAQAKSLAPAVLTKSGLMVGMGEEEGEVREAMGNLRKSGCDILTLGQYLRPSPVHWPVAKFITPEVFEAYQALALTLGFRAAACGPFVRSSYQAEEVFARVAAGAKNKGLEGEWGKTSS